MSDDTFKLSRRRLLGGLVTISGASGATGVGTMAYFSDSDESTGNTVSAGTLNLDFNSAGTFQFSSSLAPGQTTMDTVTLVNDGSITGSLDIDVAYEEPESTPTETSVSAEDVVRNLYVRTLDYGDTDLLDEQVSQSDPTLHDVSTLDRSESGTDNDLINLADPTSEGTDFEVKLELADVGDEYQGAGVDVTFAFDLNQTTGQ